MAKLFEACIILSLDLDTKNISIDSVRLLVLDLVIHFIKIQNKWNMNEENNFGF